jgi:DNA-directed RNA polymerase specialized sigma24 family protein
MLDDLESLTRRLKSAKTPEEKEQLWVELFPKLKRVAKNRIASAGRARQESATELVNDVFPGLQRALDNPAGPAASIAVSEALDALSSEMPRAVRAFELREYAGYSYDEILELMSRNYRTKALLAADLTMVRKALVRLLRAEPL